VLDELMTANCDDHDDPNISDTLEGLEHAKHTSMEYRSALERCNGKIEQARA